MKRERQALKEMWFKLKAQEAAVGEGEQWLPSPHGGCIPRPSGKVQAASSAMWSSQVVLLSSQVVPVGGGFSHFSPALSEEREHLSLKQTVWGSHGLCEETECSKRDSSGSVIVVCQKFVAWTYFPSLNEFRPFCRVSVEKWGLWRFFGFSIHRLHRRLMKILIPLRCFYHSLLILASSLRVYCFIPETRV